MINNIAIASKEKVSHEKCNSNNMEFDCDWLLETVTLYGSTSLQPDTWAMISFVCLEELF